MKTYKEIKENDKKLYKCYCGKNYYEDCKSDHIKQNKKDKNEHNMIDFKIKDYSCNCNQKDNLIVIVLHVKKIYVLYANKSIKNILEKNLQT